jgi:type I restriction enzyme S subunit
MVREYVVPLPPLPEQRRIADILDKADAIRRKRKQAIALTEELLRSAFLEMFGDPVTNPKGWLVKPLGELLDRIDSGWSPVCEARRARDDEWGVLKLGAVTSGRYNELENKACGAELTAVPELEVKAGDVLFTRKNTYEHVAACVFVGRTRTRLMLPDLIFRFVLSKKSGIRSETLWALLSNARMRKQVQGLAGGTAGSMPNISKERLKTVILPVPPMAMQDRFAGVLRGSESTHAALEAAARESEVFFNSLVARAFAGSLEAMR